MSYSSRKARLAHGVTVAESKTGGIIYTVGGSAEVSFKVKKADEDNYQAFSPRWGALDTLTWNSLSLG